MNSKGPIIFQYTKFIIAALIALNTSAAATKRTPKDKSTVPAQNVICQKLVQKPLLGDDGLRNFRNRDNFEKGGGYDDSTLIREIERTGLQNSPDLERLRPFLKDSRGETGGVIGGGSGRDTLWLAENTELKEIIVWEPNPKHHAGLEAIAKQYEPRIKLIKRSILDTVIGADPHKSDVAPESIRFLFNMFTVQGEFHPDELQDLLTVEYKLSKPDGIVFFDNRNPRTMQIPDTVPHSGNYLHIPFEPTSETPQGMFVWLYVIPKEEFEERVIKHGKFKIWKYSGRDGSFGDYYNPTPDRIQHRYQIVLQKKIPKNSSH